MSPTSPPPNTDDDWAPADRQTGRWEGEDTSSARTPSPFGPHGVLGGTPRARTPGGLSALWVDPRSRPLVLVSGLAVLGILGLACFILALVLLSDRGTTLISNPGTGPSADSTTDTTHPIAANLTATLQVRVNDTAVPVAIPNRLSMGNTVFSVVPMSTKGKGFDYDPNAKKTAFWVPGTLVNYVIGLQASSDNKPIVEALKPGDLVTLDTAVGTQRFRVTQQATVTENDVATVMSQDSPRLTLILMGEGGSERRVTLAQFTDEGTANLLTSDGTPTNLGDVRVTAISQRQRLLPGSSVGLPAGRNYFQVDFAVTSLITGFIDAAQLYTELRDGVGNVYKLSPKASTASGAAGFTKGLLQPGQTLSATAGFEVPSTMAGPTLEWQFRVKQDAPEVARVAIPYRPFFSAPTLQPTRLPRARVTIVSAVINPEGTELRVTGQVQNLTQDFLPASLTDIRLASESGQLFPLQSALPAFPWSVQPGETLTFQLAFVRPQGAGRYL